MSKTWLNKLILTIITVFTGLTILVAAFYVGYIIILEDFKGQLKPTVAELKGRSEKLADFSKIPPGYSITNALDIVGVKIVLAKYPYSGQVLGVMDTGWILNINKKGMTIVKLEEQIKTLIRTINNQDRLKINNFYVERFDNFKSLNQTIPFMKVSFSISGEHNGDYKGMIGIVNNPSTKKNSLIFSYNSPMEYKQITSERFFQSIELIGTE